MAKLTTEEIILKASGEGFEKVTNQLKAVGAALTKIENQKFRNAGLEAFKTQTVALSKSITDGFKSLEKQADLTSGAIKELAASLKSVGSTGAGGGRFGEGRLTMGTSLKSIITDMEMMLKLQARWYLARGLLFTAVELPVAAIKSVGSYILEVDKAQAEMMRWGATSGQITDQLAKDSANIVLQIRKATTEYPIAFAELSKTTQAFVGAGISQDVVARMIPDIARMQVAFKEIDFKQFAVALTGTFNVFKSTMKGASDEAEAFAAIVDKLMRAQATGIIRPEQFTTVMQYMSQIGKLSGFTLDQILAMSVALTDTGIKAQSASRLMASMMLTLQSSDKIKLLRGVGIEIDRAIPLAEQFDKIMTSLAKKIGTGPVAVGWMGFLTELVGKEQAKILVTMITNLERYKTLAEELARLKGGGLVDVAKIMSMPISSQWEIFTNMLLEIGKGVGKDADTTMKRFMATLLDVANGALVATDSTGLYADKLDKLGEAGKRTVDIINGLKAGFTGIEVVVGGIVKSITFLTEKFTSFSKGLSVLIEALGIALVLKAGSAIAGFTGKLLGVVGLGAKLGTWFTGMELWLLSLGIAFDRVGKVITAVVSGVAAHPLLALVIGITAITEVFKALNAEMDKAEKKDMGFENWVKNANTGDIQNEIVRMQAARDDAEMRKEAAQARIAAGKAITSNPKATVRDFLEAKTATKRAEAEYASIIASAQDNANQLARMRGEVAGRERKAKAEIKKPVVAGETPPPVVDKEYFARRRAALMKQYRDENQIAEYGRQEDQIKNKFALDTGLMTQEEYANKELAVAKITVDEKQRLNIKAREFLEILHREETNAARGDKKLLLAVNEKYAADKRDLDKIDKATSVEMTKAEYAEKLSSFMEYKNKVEREQSVIAAQSIATAETSADHEKNVLERQTAVLDDQYNRRVISAKAYYDAIRVITRKGVQEQIDLLEAAFTIWQTQQDEKFDSMTDTEQKAYRAQQKIKIAEKSKSIGALREGLKTTEAGRDITESNVPERVFEQAGGMTVKGFAGTFTHYLQQATKDFEDWGKQLEQIADGIAQSIRSSFEDFFFKVMKNDIENLEDLWSALGDMVMRIIANIAAQRATAGISSAINMGIDAGIAAFTKSPVAHSGGVIGTSNFPTRVVPSGIFANAPRYHSGLAGDEFPAILQRGETVLPKGSGGVVVNIKNETGTPVQAKDVKINFDLERMVVGIILKNKAQNGPLRYA